MPALLIRNTAPWSAGRAIAGDTIGIVDGRVVAIGALHAIRDRIPAGTPELDAAGGLATAGFADAHIHLGLGAMSAMQCDLAGVKSLQECLDRVAGFASGSDRPWITGSGWDLDAFPDGMPTAAMLDAVVPDRPAFLLNAGRHDAWVNTRALEAAGIVAATPDPSDGYLERGPDGAPTGLLHEGAVQLVARVMPQPDADELARGIVDVSRKVLASGITAWQEAALGEYGGIPDFTEAYLRALSSGRLRGRPTGAIWMPRDLTADSVPAFVKHCVALRDANAAAGFDTSTVKIMADGIIETKTAALREPYPDGSLGLAYFTPELLRVAVPAINAAGLSVHVHAIGDRGVGDALDAFGAVPPADRVRVRNHIAHLQLVDEADVPRFAELGVTANLQPLWAREDQVMRDFTMPLLGEARSRRIYVFGTLRRAGAAFAMGSDWPVSDFDPWQGIHVAVNRRPAGEPDAHPLIGEQEALPLSVALDAYTRGSHELLFGPGAGVLEVGARADLAIANRDPFAGAAADIHLTRTAVTIVDGEVVYGP